MGTFMNILRTLRSGWTGIAATFGVWLICPNSLFGVDLDPELTGDWPGYALRGIVSISASDNRAALACDRWGLQVLDMTNPAIPRRISGPELDADGRALNVRAVVLVGNFAYVTGRDFALHIIDLTDPTKPVRVGESGVDAGNGEGIAVGNQFAYVASMEDD